MSQAPDLKIRVRFHDGDIELPRFSIFRYPRNYPSGRLTLAPHFTMHMPDLVIEWRLVDRHISFVVDDHHNAELEFIDLNTGKPLHNPPFEIDAPVRGKRDQICTTTCNVRYGITTWSAVLFHMKIMNTLDKRVSVLDPTIICPNPVA